MIKQHTRESIVWFIRLATFPAALALMFTVELWFIWPVLLYWYLTT